MRSAALALALVWLPQLIVFLKTGAFTRGDVEQFGLQLAEAALIVLFNFLQRLRERERPGAAAEGKTCLRGCMAQQSIL